MNLSHKKSPQYFCLHVLVYLKACVRYFLSNFYFSSNYRPSKTIKCSLCYRDIHIFLTFFLPFHTFQILGPHVARFLSPKVADLRAFTKILLGLTLAFSFAENILFIKLGFRSFILFYFHERFISIVSLLLLTIYFTTKTITLSINNFLLKKSLMKNFIFCTVLLRRYICFLISILQNPLVNLKKFVSIAVKLIQNFIIALLPSAKTRYEHYADQLYPLLSSDSNRSPVLVMLFTQNLTYFSLVVRLKDESQNEYFKKTKHVKFSEKRTFFTP